VSKSVDLTYLRSWTKAKTELMMKIIELYLEQTPPLIGKMKQSLADNDWQELQGAAHKLIPSFAIVGMQIEFENITRKIQEYAETEEHLDEIPDLFLKLESACSQACLELTDEYSLYKTYIS
jgi:HPt (histidine-containing phosphotransfer) domain-containing protein